MEKREEKLLRVEKLFLEQGKVNMFGEPLAIKICDSCDHILGYDCVKFIGSYCEHCREGSQPLLLDETEVVLYREYKNQGKRLESAITRHRENRRITEKQIGFKKEASKSSTAFYRSK